jgi:hypothetical protein
MKNLGFGGPQPWFVGEVATHSWQFVRNHPMIAWIQSVEA